MRKDPYTYDESEILINLANIKNKDDLDNFENALVTLSILKIYQNKIKVKSLNNIFSIHEALFSKVYEWAGRPRLINIYKSEMVLDGLSVEYCDYKSIKKEIDKLDESFRKESWISLEKDDFIDKAVYYFSAIWKIHPFREGNTRSVSTLLILFFKQYGYVIDTDFLNANAKYFRNAFVMNSIGQYSEPEHLINFIKNSVSAPTKNDSKKYQTINGYSIEKYEYKYHSYKK